MVRNYNWKSKTGSGINVTQALLTGNKIELDDSWMKKLIEDVTISVVNQIADAQITADERFALLKYPPTVIRFH